MNRSKTNYQGIKAIEKRWLDDVKINAIPFGILRAEDIMFIDKELELSDAYGRDIISLRDARDFCVIYLAEMERIFAENEENKANNIVRKIGDCCSAVVGVIDSHIFSKGGEV